jgi:hypothetical protein
MRGPPGNQVVGPEQLADRDGAPDGATRIQAGTDSVSFRLLRTIESDARGVSAAGARGE